MPSEIDTQYDSHREAVRGMARRRDLGDFKTAVTASVAVSEEPYINSLAKRPAQLRSHATESSISEYTNDADSTYYSRPTSRPTTPKSSIPSKRGSEDGSVYELPLPSNHAQSSTSSISQHMARLHDDQSSGSGERGASRAISNEPPTLPELEAPAKINLRLKQDKTPGRPRLALVPKSSSEEVGNAACELEDSRAQAESNAQQPENITRFEEADGINSSEPISGRTQGPAKALTYTSTQLPLKDRQVVDAKMHRRARWKILAHKHSMQAFQITSNAFCIFATWFWPRYYYILLPFITATVALNVIMVVSVMIRSTWNKFRPEETITPASPESMVLLIPCYNETKEELYRSLESLVAQRKIDNHKQAIIIVCDGKARGPGMEKSTADYLLEDILTDKVERRRIPGAYTAWDQQPMDIVIQRGKYQGVPYLCIIKQQNQGKRDSLIVVRSFLYNFNRRGESPSTVFSPGFFDTMCSFIADDGGMDEVVHLVGMDADTVFDDDCIYELLEQSRYPHTVGVCGYVAVDWKDSNWNLWRLYQSAEYTIAQCLRRLHQSMVTHKVSCLPGCCQLLKVCEETCGDHVLLELFGYCPVESDNLLKQIRATASEDRNHVCHMLSARPKSQTRQALKAKAFTDVPNTWSVFLSQRRRWTLGATSNDLLLAFAHGVQWFERILALVNVITWVLNPFIIASLASFIFAILGK
jgi:chitin synthase